MLATHSKQLCRNISEFWARAHQRWSEQQWKRVLWSHEFTAQRAPVPVAWALCTYVKALRGGGILDRHMLPSGNYRLFPGTPCVGQCQASLEKPGFVDMASVCSTAVLICLPLKISSTSWGGESGFSFYSIFRKCPNYPSGVCTDPLPKILQFHFPWPSWSLMVCATQQIYYYPIRSH